MMSSSGVSKTDADDFSYQRQCYDSLNESSRRRQVAAYRDLQQQQLSRGNVLLALLTLLLV